MWQSKCMAMVKHDYFLKSFVALVVGVLLAIYGVYTYNSRIASLNQQVEIAFDEALNQELAGKKLKSKLNIKSSMSLSRAGDASAIIYIIGEQGRREYKISPEKHEMNPVKEGSTRILHSFLLDEAPIVPDTLNAIFRCRLEASNVVGKTALRISTTDTDERTSSCMSSDSLSFISTHCLFNRYLGYRCEVGIAVYIAYPWWHVVGNRLLFSFAISVLLYFLVTTLIKKIRRSSEVKEVVVTQLVQAVAKEESRLYQLKENLTFDAERSVLITDKGQVELQSQQCDFLELLLNAPGYELADDVISNHFWPGGVDTVYRLRTAVNRLRKALSIEPSIKVKRTHASCYRLSF